MSIDTSTWVYLPCTGILGQGILQQCKSCWLQCRADVLLLYSYCAGMLGLGVLQQ